MPPNKDKKRKEPPQSGPFSGNNARSNKRLRAADARAILSQSSDKAFNDKGELDVGAFIKSREYEIKALEEGMKSAKSGLSTRAFQEVPRDLRRRTASHNVKKVPTRLRRRAQKEMIEDKTPPTSAREKDLTSKQRLRRDIAKKAAAAGAKARRQRDGLAKSQKLAAKARPEETVSQAEDDVKTVSFNKGHEAPASVNPIHPPNPKKGVLSKAPKPVSKFRKRQKEKTWLPTHVYHTKRAHMTLPNNPLWRFAIPLSPTEKVYRTTHRAANMRGCIAWDMSYMSTIMVEGVERSILGALREMGACEEMLTGGKGAKWRQGSRSWRGWLRERDSPESWIAETMVVWCPQILEDVDMAGTQDQTSPRKRQIMLRVHPAGFLQLWNELLKVAKMQRPTVSVEDLRYQIGSIEVEGPNAAEALVGVLHPIQTAPDTQKSISPASILSALAKVSDPALLPSGALLNFMISDPRLFHPPRRLDLDETTDEALLELLANWTPDRHPATAHLFDRHARFAADRLQSSQKAINRRKGDSVPGAYPKHQTSDPLIPALLCANQPNSGLNRHGSWILMVSWNWVLPLWYSLMHFPLSSGGNPRLGGLDERRQLSFEKSVPFYPTDFVGTKAGLEWEATECEKRKKEWEKRPKGKRVEWSSLDLGRGGDAKGEIGRGWSCDWWYLLGKEEEPHTKMPGSTKDEEEEQAKTNPEAKQPKVSLDTRKVVQVFADQIRRPNFAPSEGSLITVSLKLLQRGVPATCARIYRLPSDDSSLRERWLDMLQSNSRSPESRQLKTSRAVAKAEEAQTESIHDTESYPPVPGEQDLVGFVTTGNFNLGEGVGTAVGCIALRKVWSKALQDGSKAEGMCIVRNAGTSMGRLAQWIST